MKLGTKFETEFCRYHLLVTVCFKWFIAVCCWKLLYSTLREEE